MTPVRFGIDHAVQPDENLNHIRVFLQKRHPPELDVQIFGSRILKGPKFTLITPQSSVVVLEK
jgi:hypothetical protein